MTIFHLAAIVVVLACGLITQSFFPASLMSRLISFLAGCAVPIVVHQVGWPIIDWLTALPACRKHRCRHRWHYRRDRVSAEGVSYRCRCGETYLLTDTEFKVVRADGSAEPYMRRKSPRARWAKAQ